VWSIDGASWKYKRPYFVPFIFQISLHLVEYQPSIPTKQASNIFPHDVARPDFSNNSKHLRPEVAVIFFSKSLAGCTVWLAWESSGENINLPCVWCCVELFNVPMTYCVWKVMF
jgi:hypothetical protein